MQAALAPSTVETYRRAWSSYNLFSQEYLAVPATLPLSVSHICLFVAYLHHKNMAPKSISCSLSALAYVHKIGGFPDPTSAFLISKLVAGAYRLRPSVDVRLPITVPILDRLVSCLAHVTASFYERCLFQAMFLFAFNAFARIGEITTNNSGSQSRVLQFSDVVIHQNQGFPSRVSVTFRFFKHNLTSSPHTISFEHGPTSVSALLSVMQYFRVRGDGAGPLFCHACGQSVTRTSFDRLLHSALKFCNLDGSRYKGHSFRIGAATYAAQNNMSDSQIRALGRWSSNAFRKYIRLTG